MGQSASVDDGEHSPIEDEIFSESSSCSSASSNESSLPKSIAFREGDVLSQEDNEVNNEEDNEEDNEVNNEEDDEVNNVEDNEVNNEEENEDENEDGSEEESEEDNEVKNKEGNEVDNEEDNEVNYEEDNEEDNEVENEEENEVDNEEDSEEDNEVKNEEDKEDIKYDVEVAENDRESTPNNYVQSNDKDSHPIPSELVPIERKESDNNDPQCSEETPAPPSFTVLNFSTAQLEKSLSASSITVSSIMSNSLKYQHEVALYEGDDPAQRKNIDLHTRIASSILSLSPVLRLLRFRMVPAKMSEGRFWGSVFYILEEGREKSSTNGSGMTEQSESVEESRRLLCKRDVEISQLRRDLNSADATIAELKGLLANYDNVSNGADRVVEKGHNGKWIMDQDCADFLLFDEELKQNLRSTKTKRLEEVLDQMKFILDTDDIQNTCGKWDCCEKDSYNADGCS